jgi:hypothetical protein
VELLLLADTPVRRPHTDCTSTGPPGGVRRSPRKPTGPPSAPRPSACRASRGASQFGEETSAT